MKRKLMGVEYPASVFVCPVTIVQEIFKQRAVQRGKLILK
ncbi:hypothetical protein HMPREF9374_1406 [Desmospora sp. 8437]|nr:hypothetical protein HMPREF9374_1406 [Desmospora sp. 8437]